MIKMVKPVIDYEKCKTCKTCREVCPMDCFDLKEEENKVVVERPEACIGCRACEVQCPEGAISIVEDDE